MTLSNLLIQWHGNSSRCRSQLAVPVPGLGRWGLRLPLLWAARSLRQPGTGTPPHPPSYPGWPAWEEEAAKPTETLFLRTGFLYAYSGTQIQQKQTARFRQCFSHIKNSNSLYVRHQVSLELNFSWLCCLRFWTRKFADSFSLLELIHYAFTLVLENFKPTGSYEWHWILVTPSSNFMNW